MAKLLRATLISLILSTFTSSSYTQTIQLDWGYQLGSSGVDAGVATATDPEGNVYVAGVFSGTVDFDPGSDTLALVAAVSGESYFIKKLDTEGNLIWAKKLFGSPFWRAPSLHRLAVDIEGNVLFTGDFTGTADADPGPNTYSISTSQFTDFDMFILKLDTNGEFLWATRTGGATHDEFVMAISTDNYGNIYTTGYFRDTVDFDPGPGTFNLIAERGSRVFIQKLDSLGNFLWAQIIGDTSSVRVDLIKTDPSGNVLVVGFFVASVDFDPGPDTFILTTDQRATYTLKLDENGDFGWARYITTYNYQRPSLAIDEMGNVYLCGVFSGLVDFDPGGTSSSSIISHGIQDVFIQKLTDHGDFGWVKHFGANPGAISLPLINEVQIADDATGNLHVLGRANGEIDYDPGPGVHTRGTNSVQFVASYSKGSGDLNWVESIESQGLILVDFTLDRESNLYLTGRLSKNATAVDIDPGPDSLILSTINKETDAILIKWSQDSSSVGIDPEFQAQVKYFPNPTAETLYIDLGATYVSADIAIFSMEGRLLDRLKFRQIDKLKVELPDQAGIYFLQITADNQQAVLTVQRE